MDETLALFLGRTTLDALYWLETLPEENTKVFARQFHAAPGGPALNAALTYARLAHAQPPDAQVGGKTLLVSAVGGGPWAGAVRAELERNRVGLLDLAADTGYETPLCAALLNGANGSRTVVNPPMDQTVVRRLGAWEQEAGELGGAILPGARPQVVMTDGFFFDEARVLLRSLRDAGAVICLDGGSWKPGTDELASLVTVAICSERFQLPTEICGEGSDANAAIDWFAGKGVPCIAVTRGGNSILCWERGRRFEIDVTPIAAVDTLGAGDVLHGAFCYYFAQSREFEPALRRAAEIATLSCRSLGTRAWAAERDTP